jgi:hypothetical protein
METIEMLEGSSKERAKVMQNVKMDIDSRDEVCINVYRNGKCIGQKILCIPLFEHSVPADPDKPIVVKAKFEFRS